MVEKSLISDSGRMYAISKTGKMLLYQCKVYKAGGIGLIEETTGQLHGKHTIKTSSVKKGKNIGKANATNPASQAMLDGQSKINSKLTEGYKTAKMFFNFYKPNIVDWNFDDITSTETKLQQIFIDYKIWHNTDEQFRIKPMLAHKYKDHKKKVKFPALIQPKYNGVRCLAQIVDNKFKLRSREGIDYNVPHIEKALNEYFLEDMLNTGFELDGELYIHGRPLNEIVHLVRTNSIDSLEIVYVVYDLANCNNTEQIDRFNSLKELNFHKTKDIVLALTTIVSNHDEIATSFNVFKNNGFEGAIVRNYVDIYEPSFRSYGLLKVKSTISEEFTIVGVELPNSGIIEDFNWVCQTKANKIFKVKAHDTVEMRKHYYNNSNDYIGKKLSLSFFEYTKEGFPFHITEVVVRDYE